MSGLDTVPDNLNFPEEERKTLEKWTTDKTFEKSLEFVYYILIFHNLVCRLSKDRPRYTFFDGPPFATGLPHYGHILAGTIKVFIYTYSNICIIFCVGRRNKMGPPKRFLRWKTFWMGHSWSTSGWLKIPFSTIFVRLKEFEVDKTLGIKGPSDIMAMGIDKYNAECRSIVMRYSKV